MPHNRKVRLLLLFLAGLLAGCASSPGASNAAGDATTSASGEPKVVLTTSQARKYASEDEVKRARRECMRRMRRITGSRIPRNSCPGGGGLYSGAYNQQQESQESAGVP